MQLSSVRNETDCTKKIIGISSNFAFGMDSNLTLDCGIINKKSAVVVNKEI
jgi:hypothetical protein